MEPSSSAQLVGGPCGQHGPYTFYKAFKYTTKSGRKRIVRLSEFFFVKLWVDSDLLCIGELQLLWNDRNSEQVLSSLRLYFLPENTPDGRMDHGEDEVLAITEKVVLRLEDLISWITVDTEWTWGRLATYDKDVKEPSNASSKRSVSTNTALLRNSYGHILLDFSDVEKERKLLEANDKGRKEEKKRCETRVIILSYPRYCRYRAMMKRLEGAEHTYLKDEVIRALGGFSVPHRNTRVLFCRDTFDYPELETHELLCNHLAPKLKGRPRGKRKKYHLSPEPTTKEPKRAAKSNLSSRVKRATVTAKQNADTTLRRSSRHNAMADNESKAFLQELNNFVQKTLPHQNAKDAAELQQDLPLVSSQLSNVLYSSTSIDLFDLYSKVQKLGGYDGVTTNRLWRTVATNTCTTSVTGTVIRRHYERFLLAYERHVKTAEHDTKTPRVRKNMAKGKTKSTEVPPKEEKDEKPAMEINLNTVEPSDSAQATTDQPTSSDQHLDDESTPLLKRIRLCELKEKNSVCGTPDDAKDADSLACESELKVVPKKKHKEKENSLSKQSSTSLRSIRLKTERQKENAIVIAKSPLSPRSASSPPICDIDNPTPSNSSSNMSACIERLTEPNDPIQSPASPVCPKPNGALNALVSVPRKSVVVNSSPSYDFDKNFSSPTKPYSSPSITKQVEPLTTAITPIVVQQLCPPLKSLSPAEGKENIPLEEPAPTPTSTTPTPTTPPPTPVSAHQPPTLEILQVPSPSLYKPSLVNHNKDEKCNVDKPKLSAIEIDAIPSISNSVRPSVIQPNTARLPKKRYSEIITPPPKRRSIHPAVFDSRKVNNNIMFEIAPPNVIQSKSIFSYSVQKVYGDPNEPIVPSMFTTVKYARPRTTTNHRGPIGNGLLDLTATIACNQKTAIEIHQLPLAAHRVSLPQLPPPPHSLSFNNCRPSRSSLEITLVRQSAQNTSQTTRPPPTPTPPSPTPTPSTPPPLPQPQQHSSPVLPPPQQPELNTSAVFLNNYIAQLYEAAAVAANNKAPPHIAQPGPSSMPTPQLSTPAFLSPSLLYFNTLHDMYRNAAASHATNPPASNVSPPALSYAYANADHLKQIELFEMMARNSGMNFAVPPSVSNILAAATAAGIAQSQQRIPQPSPPTLGQPNNGQPNNANGLQIIPNGHSRASNGTKQSYVHNQAVFNSFKQP